MYLGGHAQYLYTCQVSMELEFSRQIFRYLHVSYVTKIRPMGATQSHADKTWRS